MSEMHPDHDPFDAVYAARSVVSFDAYLDLVQSYAAGDTLAQQARIDHMTLALPVKMLEAAGFTIEPTVNAERIDESRLHYGIVVLNGHTDDVVAAKSLLIFNESANSVHILHTAFMRFERLQPTSEQLQTTNNLDELSQILTPAQLGKQLIVGFAQINDLPAASEALAVTADKHNANYAVSAVIQVIQASTQKNTLWWGINALIATKRSHPAVNLSSAIAALEQKISDLHKTSLNDEERSAYTEAITILTEPTNT